MIVILLWAQIIFLSLLNLLQHCFYFMFWYFWPLDTWVLTSWPGIKPAPPALEVKVLTIGLPGKSHRLLCNWTFLKSWMGLNLESSEELPTLVDRLKGTESFIITPRGPMESPPAGTTTTSLGKGCGAQAGTTSWLETLLS